VLGKVRKQKSPGTANRVRALLNRLFNVAIEEKILPPGGNPCTNIKKLAEPTGREVFLTTEQIVKLLRAVDADENRLMALGVKLLVFTGCRKSEVFGLRWDAVDLNHKQFRVEWNTAKGKRVEIKMINTLALEVFQEALTLKPEPDTPWVFPSLIGGKAGYITDPRSLVQRAKKRVDLPPGFRIHDIRHSFASMLARRGESLYTIQKMLGHVNPSTTQKYAHFQVDHLQRASDVVAEEIGRAMDEDEG
jgi:integrase